MLSPSTLQQMTTLGWPAAKIAHLDDTTAQGYIALAQQQDAVRAKATVPTAAPASDQQAAPPPPKPANWPPSVPWPPMTKGKKGTPARAANPATGDKGDPGTPDEPGIFDYSAYAAIMRGITQPDTPPYVYTDKDTGQSWLIHKGGASAIQRAKTGERFVDDPQSGERWLIDANGSPHLVEPPTALEQRDRRLLAGDITGALALDDFMKRPTSQQAFDAALAYARSPADVFTLSNIAHGNLTLPPPPIGQTQRVGPQSQDLQRAYADYQNARANPFQNPQRFNRTDVQNLHGQQMFDQNGRPIQGVNLDANPNPFQLGITPPAAAIGGPPPGQEGWNLNQAGQWSYNPGISQQAPVTSGNPPGQGNPQRPDPSVSGQGVTIQIGASGMGSSTGPQAPMPGVQDQADEIARQQMNNSFRPPPDAGGSFQVAPGEQLPAFAMGGTMPQRGPAVVGERGPEMVNLPRGAQVIPMGQLSSPFAFPQMQHLDSGTGSFDPGYDNSGDSMNAPPVDPFGRYPKGVGRVMAGGALNRPKSLFDAAGITLPSAQAWHNMLPSEQAVYREIGQTAGIPLDSINQELQGANPGGRQLGAFNMSFQRPGQDPYSQSYTPRGYAGFGSGGVF